MLIGEYDYFTIDQKDSVAARNYQKRVHFNLAKRQLCVLGGEQDRPFRVCLYVFWSTTSLH